MKLKAKSSKELYKSLTKDLILSTTTIIAIAAAVAGVVTLSHACSFYLERAPLSEEGTVND